MGSKKSDKSTVTVSTPAPSKEEADAQRKSAAANDIAMSEAGYVPKYDESGNFASWEKRALTADEQKRKDQEDQLFDLAYKKLTGTISDEDRKLVEQEYESASKVGRSNIKSEFDRALEGLNLQTGRDYEDIQSELKRGVQDINRSATESAGARGFSLLDSPVNNERMQNFARFGEDVNKLATRTAEDSSRNQRLLGEDFTRNVSNFETSLAGAKAGSMLDVGQRQQLFGMTVMELQKNLQQQALQNKAIIGDAFNQTAMGMGNLRSRNMVQTSKGGSSQGVSASQGMGAFGGLMQGAGSLLSAWKSSRKFKENIQPANIDEMLEQLEEMAIYTYKYKPEFMDSRQHIGPMVEESPKSLTDGLALVNQDMIGFLFGALKALNEKVKKLETV